jgi:hypothetical protein
MCVCLSAHPEPAPILGSTAMTSLCNWLIILEFGILQELAAAPPVAAAGGEEKPVSKNQMKKQKRLLL